jgi:hypothetical protein
MKSQTNSLHFAKTHNGSPSAATIHSKTARLERGITSTCSCHWAAGNGDGNVLYSDTSSASYLPPMSMPSQKHQVLVGNTISQMREAACRSPCHNDGGPGGTPPRPFGWPPQLEGPVLAWTIPSTAGSRQRRGRLCNQTWFSTSLPEKHKHKRFRVLVN